VLAVDGNAQRWLVPDLQRSEVRRRISILLRIDVSALQLPTPRPSHSKCQL
jgi:hypothetical protein